MVKLAEKWRAGFCLRCQGGFIGLPRETACLSQAASSVDLATNSIRHNLFLVACHKFVRQQRKVMRAALFGT
jgi:hypothetical protein